MVAFRTNQGAFKVDLEKFAKKISVDVGLVRKKVAIDLFALVQAPEKATSDGLMIPGVRHPVDTGRARAGWAMSDGAPSSYVPAPGVGSTDPSVVSNERNSATFASPFQITWIVNNVPYISVLEFGGYPGDGPRTSGGFSNQAPGGWVRKSISLLEFALNNIKQEL